MLLAKTNRRETEEASSERSSNGNRRSPYVRTYHLPVWRPSQAVTYPVRSRQFRQGGSNEENLSILSTNTHMRAKKSV